MMPFHEMRRRLNEYREKITRLAEIHEALSCGQTQWRLLADPPYSEVWAAVPADEGVRLMAACARQLELELRREAEALGVIFEVKIT